MKRFASKVIEVLRQEVGYLEKKSGSQLEDKTANAGYNNYTKYARDLDALGYFYNGPKQGYPYCDVTVDWAFVQAYGVEAALELLCQPERSYGAGCGYSARYYQNKGQWHTKDPKPGDQIFFRNFAHTGLVIAVDEGYVHTIEGNTSPASGVIANGGGVWQKKYKRNDPCIDGYGRPNYDPEPEEGTAAPEAPDAYTREKFIREVQAAIGAEVDGIAGPETRGKTVTVSRYRNAAHPVVKPIQKRLHALGYTIVGEADGEAGPLFSLAVKQFQRDHSCITDGELTRAMGTWKELLKA